MIMNLMCLYSTAQVSVPMSVEFDELKKIRESPGDEANNMVEFSDEEGYGKFLIKVLIVW